MPRPDNRRGSTTAGKGPGARPWLLGGVLGAAAVVGLVGVWLLQPPRRVPQSAVAIGGPFTLTEGNGHQVTDRDFRGKYLLVYFGYTSCPDVCPTTLNEVSSAMAKLGAEAAKVQPLFVTVDPDRDTPAVIEQYASSFPPVIGLTGTADQVGQVARAYRVTYAQQRTGAGPNDYTVDHSSVLYLMGPDGRFVAPIPADADASKIAADVAADLL